MSAYACPLRYKESDFSINFTLFANVSCDNLFIDANSLIYDCIHELKKVENEEKVYEMVYEKIIQLIQTIDPKIKTYVCFDGIPPYPKMVQQRQRRFKSVLTKQILNDTSCSWNTNHITPGTDFMNKLDDFLTIKFKKEKKVSFSGSNEPMEGEHKICYYLRSQQNLYENKTFSCLDVAPTLNNEVLPGDIVPNVKVAIRL